MTDRKNTSRKTISRDNSYPERGGIRKKWHRRLPVALIFPNSYRVGMSNLGFQLVYDLLNQRQEIVAERFFMPAGNRPPRSLETSRPLTDFPLLCVSLSFEADYPYLAGLLAAAGIPPLAAERDREHPLILGGGVATFINPEPLAPFIDVFLIGEAEPLLPAALDFLLAGLTSRPRTDLLKEMARRLPGCYVPRFYRTAYKDGGRLQEMTFEAGLPSRIRKIILEKSPAIAGHSRLHSPAAEFADLHLTELGRGCSRGCRFCAAGFVYRPPRRWDAAAIIRGLDARPDGYSRVGLLGMEMTPTADLTRIADYLVAADCSLSFSSLRADAITPILLKLLAGSRLKSVAIAPDGPSERLRRVINKGISEADILTAAEALVKAGIRNLKLYFMIGLPTENQDDLEEMAALTRKVHARILSYGRGRGRLSTITLSVNCFIPKPWTPFQFHPFADGNERPAVEMKKRLSFLRRMVSGIANLHFKAEKPESAWFQSLLARGDRRLGPVLADLAVRGGSWRQACRRAGLTVEHETGRRRDPSEFFPWEIIDHGIDRNYLWAEYRKALAGGITPPCEPARCKRCGVCNTG